MTKRVQPTKAAIRLTNLWQNFGGNTYPLDIDELVKRAIQDSSFADELIIKREQFDSIEGALVRVPKTRTWTILLNSEFENERRERFTFAHELGHFFCHRELQPKFQDTTDTLNDYRDELEREANAFAAWLLMPANITRDEFAHKFWDVSNLRAMGNRFEASLQACGLRFIDLCPRPTAFVVSRDGMINWATKSASAPFMQRFQFGDELPVVPGTTDDTTAPIRVSRDLWAEGYEAHESHYYDQSGLGYQYTCIEFFG